MISLNKLIASVGFQFQRKWNCDASSRQLSRALQVFVIFLRHRGLLVLKQNFLPIIIEDFPEAGEKFSDSERPLFVDICPSKYRSMPSCLREVLEDTIMLPVILSPG